MTTVEAQPATRRQPVPPSAGPEGTPAAGAQRASTDPNRALADLGAHPPKARLALNIGVIAYGVELHQSTPTPVMLAQIGSVLKMASAAAGAAGAAAPATFRDRTPRLRVISTLATKLERAAARAALECGYEVQTVLTRDRARLAQSLASEGRAELAALLDRATAVLELDGADGDSTAAREADEAAAEVLLDQSDLLLVLGDADDLSARGAWYAVDQAHERELAMATLGAEGSAPVSVTICDRLGSPCRVDLAGLQTHLQAMLAPPALADPATLDAGPTSPDPLRDYFAEVVPARSWLAWTWTLFVGIVADSRLRRPSIRVTAFANSITEWDRIWQTAPPLPAALGQELDRTLRTPYVWPDSLSLYYGGAYRGSFVVSILLGMATVLLVLLSFAVGTNPNDDLSRIASVVFVLVILAVTRLANKRRWHERWLDYRLLAELLRQQRFLAPLGRVPAFARLPAHDSYDDPRGTWMAWQAHAVARDAGLVTAKVDQPYRDAYLAFLRDGLITGIAPDGGQLGYHDTISRRFERLERRAGDLQVGLMWAAIAVALFEVADNRIWDSWNLPVWFPALVAVFAALGGAITSVAGQADASRMKKRSRAMRERLDHVRASLERPEAAVSAATLGEVAEAAADAMVAELADYRMVFQGKPLRYPR